MKLDHQAHPGSHRLAYGGDDSDRELALLGRQVFPGGAKRVELHPAVAARDHVPRPLGVLRGGARAAVPPVGVGRDAPVAAPPKEPVDGLVAGLADDVPERDLNAADRRHHRAAALVLVAHHGADDRLDVERVATQHPVLDPLVDEGLDRLLLPLQRGLADARQPGVGAEADEEVVAQPGVGHPGLELSDPHSSASASPVPGRSLPQTVAPRRSCRLSTSKSRARRMAVPLNA